LRTSIQFTRMALLAFTHALIKGLPITAAPGRTCQRPWCVDHSHKRRCNCQQRVHCSSQRRNGANLQDLQHHHCSVRGHLESKLQARRQTPSSTVVAVMSDALRIAHSDFGSVSLRLFLYATSYQSKHEYLKIALSQHQEVSFLGLRCLGWPGSVQGWPFGLGSRRLGRESALMSYHVSNLHFRLHWQGWR
jgi:hypothetical protein